MTEAIWIAIVLVIVGVAGLCAVAALKIASDICREFWR